MTHAWSLSLDHELESLYRSERSVVRRLIRRLGVPCEDADDVMQEVFLVLHARWSELDRGPGLRFWVRAVAVRLSSNHRRSQARKVRERWSGDCATVLERWRVPGECLPDERSARTEHWRALESALERLGEGQREVFVQAELEQRTAAEIGETLGLSPNTVASRLRVARRRVAAIFLCDRRPYRE